MSWNPLDWIKPINKGLDIVDQAVLDKDKANELKEVFKQLQEQTYQLELGTKTIPWVDALHKMGRQIISLFSIVMSFALLYFRPETDAAELAALNAPGGIYNWIKGKGR